MFQRSTPAALAQRYPQLRFQPSRCLTRILILSLLVPLGCSPTHSETHSKPNRSSVAAETGVSDDAAAHETLPTAEQATPDSKSSKNTTSAATTEQVPTAQLETVTLGAGCFWCIEAVLLRIKGVESVQSGYMGGTIPRPSYEMVCTGRTGHAEVVQLRFDPQILPFEKLLDIFFQAHDPTTLNRQGFDVGTQYRSAIFYHTEAQKETAQASLKKWNESGKFHDPIVTEISPASEFYAAEGYHQDYFNKNPGNPYCRANILPKFKKLGLLKEDDK